MVTEEGEVLGETDSEIDIITEQVTITALIGKWENKLKAISYLFRNLIYFRDLEIPFETKYFRVPIF